MKINCVIEGDYKGNKIYNYSKNNYLSQSGGWPFTKAYISSYTVIDESNKEYYSLGKSLLAVALDVPLGWAYARNQRTEYLIAIEWKDGDKSLICIDDEYYKIFVASLF